MTTPDKDQVLDTSVSNDAGADVTPSTSDASEPAAAATAAAPASASEAEAAGATEAAESVAEGDAEVVDAEVIDPELAAEADAAVEGVATDSEVVAAAKAEVAEWKDKYMRLHAEWDTYRRRTSEQREAEKARATEKLVTNLLPVLDDFERTITYAKDNGETGLLGGVEAVYSKLVGTLTKDGVEVIDPAGEAFDALEAQAVATVDDASVPDETVAQVYQKGYRMGTKVLRPAMVTVTTGGPKRPKPEE